MGNATVLKVVDLILQDPQIVHNKYELYIALGLPSSDFVQLDNGFKNETKSTKNFFVEMISRWVSRAGREATVGKLNQILIEIHHQYASDFLTTQYPTLSAKIVMDNSKSTKSNDQFNEPIWMNFKEKTEHFVGREIELESLQSSLSQNKNKFVLISGLGGIGKSEIVRSFAKQIHKEEKVNCVWLKGESGATLKDSIFKLASLLRVKTKAQSKDKSVEQVLNEIVKVATQMSSKWFFVIDNVDEKPEQVAPLIRMLIKVKDSLVVVTSRLRKWNFEEVEFLDLIKLSNEEASSFVVKSIKDCNTEEVGELCEILDNFPLALQQAVAYIKAQKRNSIKGNGYGIKDYLKEYESSQLSQQKLLDHPIRSLEGNERTTYTTWDITIHKIRSEERIGRHAFQILCSLAYLHPDGISSDFLNELLQPLEKGLRYNVFMNSMIWQKRNFMGLTREKVDLKLNECLELFKSYSLVSIEEGVVDIHRLVQKVIQIDCSMNGQDKKILRILSEGSRKAFEKKLKYDKLRQILTIWNHIKKDGELTTTFKNTPVELAQRLCDLTLFSQMLEFCKETVERFESLLPETDSDVLRMQAQLVNAYDLNGEDEEALKISKEIYLKMKVKLGEVSKDTLYRAFCVGNALKGLKRFDEAEALYQSMLDSQRKLSGGKDNESICRANKELARVLLDNGKFSRGLEVFQEVLEWERKNMGEKHPDTFRTKLEILRFHSKQGDLNTYNEMYQELYKHRIEVLGEEHPDTLVTKYNLSITYYDLGQVETAFKMLDELLSLMIKVLGEKHPHTLMTKELIEHYSNPNYSK